MARNEQDREKFLEILATTPFINHACKRVGISRATIYRWMKDNPRFKRKVLKKSEMGRENLVEIAEVALVNRVREGELPAIRFFLSHNSKRYQTKSNDFEEELEKKSPTALIEGPDGKIVVTKRSMDILNKMREESRRRKNRAMGFPDPPDP